MDGADRRAPRDAAGVTQLGHPPEADRVGRPERRWRPGRQRPRPRAHPAADREDVESFTLVDPGGEVHEVSRESEPDLFRLVIGGYGLLGVVTSVRLRLAPRRPSAGSSALVSVDELMDDPTNGSPRVPLGDCQFSIDERSATSSGSGSSRATGRNRHCDPRGPTRVDDHGLGPVLYLTHVDRAARGQGLRRALPATSGQLYWSDLHQRSDYITGYHAALDRATGANARERDHHRDLRPRPSLASFMTGAANALRDGDPLVVYGTIRWSNATTRRS